MQMRKMLCVLCSWAYPVVCLFLRRLNLNNVSYVICHKIINLELESVIFLGMPFSFC